MKKTDLANYIENVNKLTKITEPDVPYIFDKLELPDYNQPIPIITRELWTARQRQAHSLHEISYRACFKPQLPRFFISRLTTESQVVYDPFAGRGTTALEAAFLGRKFISNDINPLSKILTQPRLLPPSITSISDRLKTIPKKPSQPAINHLDMFYHKDTFDEILALREYFLNKEKSNSLDGIDSWIRMVATNRLTGHSPGFFSVYTLPPNQATSIEGQIKINEKYKQRPEYKNTYDIIIKKSRSLLSSEIQEHERVNLDRARKSAIFLTKDARNTPEIESESVALTVTSPPFLDIVQYAEDNWLRCWFNGLDANEIGKNISTPSSIEVWQAVMKAVFLELYRISIFGGHVAFEVGEVRRGRVQMENLVMPIAISAGFQPVGVLLNEQVFTKTSHIWGVENNSGGTNTNRIVLLKKP
ncbi:DNA methylase [Geothrix limicola]|uniref:site-specific DNA-methyltransferase (cytosine-N(4)-specific) n=1 Tax=Geothrix limicola TaxID=2927978 RepID=A0ABQ5QDB9_9BACT|nr:DNA methyltransferase [Geothrix limicola]GLH72657.1 DNA methylase [Geothrix limicola]